MRAHFAGDVAAINGSDAAAAAAANDSIDRIESEAEPLEARIDEFKQDSKNMEVVSEFIDDVLQKAEVEAVKQQCAKNGKNSQQPKEKSRQSFTIPDFKNGKMVNRARGLVVRIFDAICNCANTAAGPAQRIKLRAKRATTAAAATENGGNVGAGENQPAELKDKAKKQENGKEKKPDKKQKESKEAKESKEQIDSKEDTPKQQNEAEECIKEAEAEATKQ